MNYIDEIILEHISFEYVFGLIPNDGQMLAEEHGKVPNINRYGYGIIEFFRESILPFIKDGGTYAENIKNPGILGDFKKFFNVCDISVMATLKDGGASWSSYYDQKSSLFFDDGGFVKINLSCAASTPEQLESLLATNFCHEISHAYEDYMRKRHGAPSMKDITSDMKYASKLMAWKYGDTENRRILGKTMYWLDKMELKALIGQIPVEIEGKSVGSPKEALEAIKSTNAYAVFNKLWNNVSFIESCEDRMTQNDLLAGYEFITGRKVDWKTFVADLDRLWERWKYKFLQNVGKIAYDYYCNTQPPIVNTKID